MSRSPAAARSRSPTSAREIEALGRRALAHPCDVGDPVAVKALFAAIEREFGRLDLLFNNAGAGAPAVPMDELTYEQWKAVVDVNLTGRVPLRAGRDSPDEAPEPARRAHHQQRLDLRPCAAADSAPYTATKHAITGLTKSIALDGRAFDIACGQIDIGNALTEMAFKHDVGRAAGRRAHRRRADDRSGRGRRRRSSTWRACRSPRTSCR